MSEHCCPVVELGPILAHPNADRLGLTEVNGYTVVVAKDNWRQGDLAVFIEPDYVVPDTDDFAWLKGHRRIRPSKLRGVMSEGLLIPAPAGADVGDNVMERMGIARYEPPINEDTRGSAVTGKSRAESPHPSLRYAPRYDLENGRKLSKLFAPGEPVYVTEKIHGANARYAFREGRMWCGSRNEWKEQSESSAYWMALEAEPWIEQWCRANPTAVLYGEVYGWVADLRYGHGPGEVSFRAFDVLTLGGGFMDAQEFVGLPGIQAVPCVFMGEFDADRIRELAESDSCVLRTLHDPQMSEGVVVKPWRERWQPGVGRVALKWVSSRYLAGQR